MRIDDALHEPLSILQRAYPNGVPKADYLALLAELSVDMSEENVAIVVAELIDGERVVIGNDLAAALSVRRPAQEAVGRVRERLRSAGWRWGEDSLG